MNLFVTSDIHGMYNQFEELLTYWNQEDKLIILGDLIDRGPKSLQVIQKVMELKETYGEQVVFCKGNHEDMLLNFLTNYEEKQEHYFRNGGLATIHSFLPSEALNLPINEQVDYIKTHYLKELDFLKQANLFTIIGDVLFTHAGFNSELEDFRATEPIDFIWIRKHYEKPNGTPYVNIFGHTPTRYIHETDNIWTSADQTYIAIDGACVYGGQLNGVRLTQEGSIIETVHVKGSNMLDKPTVKTP